MVRAAWLLSAIVGLVNGLASTDTITWGGDNTRAGYQTNHNMDPAVVGSSQFGQLFKTTLPGNYKGYKEQIFSQPLVFTPGGGDQQFVYFSTTQNNVYKLDARTGEIVASRNLHIPFLTADLDGCVDINPTIGIIGTGVIDPSTETIYLAAKTYVNQQSQDPQGRPAGRYFIHALNVNDLSERPNYPIDLEGMTARNNPTRMFNGGIALQRPGFLHSGQYIYAGFGSHCVQYNTTGWIVGWDKTTGKIVERFGTEGEGVSNDINGGSVWMSGGGLASDDAGSIFYSTGNGYASQLATIPVKGFNPPTALEQAVVHMTQNADGSLNLVDFFMPHEKQALDGGDKDLGTSPLQILPKEFSCGEYTRMGVITGKSGKTYWVNLDELGGYRNGPNGLDDVIQVYQNENSVYAGAGVYPLEGGYIYINVIQYPTHVFKFSCDNNVPSFAKVADSPANNAYILGVSHGTVTSLNGQPGTGLLWNTDVQGDNLRIYDAVPQDGKLKMIKSFSVPGTTKFSRAVFGDGKIYIGTTQGFVYGFGSPVKTPLSCTSVVEFGQVDVSQESADKQVTCTALVGVTVTGMRMKDTDQYRLSGLPSTPLQLVVGGKFTVNAKFAPRKVGLVSDNILVDTTNNVAGYSTQSSVRLSGTGQSAGALLFLSPDKVTFQGIITGNDPNGLKENIILSNQGNSVLAIKSVSFSTKSADGPFEAWAGVGSLKVGKFAVDNIPTQVAASSSVTLSIGFDSSVSGTFSGFVKLVTDGGEGVFSIKGTAGPAPVAFLEFQTLDATKWVKYKPGTPFTFGDVMQNTARSLKFRVTNNAPAGGVSLSLTVSKPPFGINSIVRAANQVDLAEGTLLSPGQSATAVITCSVPKSPWNVDSYPGTATWTMNTNDPIFEKNFINFDCRAVSPQAPPLLGNGNGKFRYVGCFKENNPGRQLSNQLYGNDKSTSAMCINTCAGGNFVFCGTQYHRECWGGNKMPTLKVDDIHCNYDCAGDINQICGGNGEGTGAGGSYMSLFADSTKWDGTDPIPPNPGDPDPPTPQPGTGSPVVNPGVSGYSSIGCHTEAINGRALPFEKKLESPTVAKCVEACSVDKYTHAGLQYAGECWCGNQLGTGSVPAPANECSLACKGNPLEFCGGNSRLNVYTLGDVPGTPLPTSTTSSQLPSVQPISSTTPAAPSQIPTKPAAKETVGNYKLEGCYMETTTGRALSGKTFALDDMTLEACATFCGDFKLFGVEYGRECYCGNTLGEGSVKAENQNDCSFLCPGDKSTFCGAGMRLQLYKKADESSLNGTPTPVRSVAAISSTSQPLILSSLYSSSTPSSSYSSSSFIATSSKPLSAFTVSTTSLSTKAPTLTSSSTSSTLTTIQTSIRTSTTSQPIPSGPIVYAGNTNFTYYSCVQEPSKGRLLPKQVFNDGKEMTVKACLERCWEFNYAGVEYGRECWCGNKLNLAGNSGATPGKHVTDTQCSFLCPGDKNVYCGAGGKMNLYVRKDIS